VFELKMIGVKHIADQLRAIAAAEQIAIDDAALMLIARAGDGSMRDAQSSFDQVIGFAGATITADDVASVLGLVRRDLLIAITDAVGRDDAAAVFDLAAQAVESGYDLRLVVRELARMTRDLLVLSIDPSRVADPEIAAESERQALLDLSRRFSGEDLMRAFDVLTKAEYEIRGAMQPRYQLEMALLRWIHLRKLVPLTDFIKQLEAGAPRAAPVTARPVPPIVTPARPAAPAVAPVRPVGPAPTPMAAARPEPAPGRSPAAPPGPPKPGSPGEGGKFASASEGGRIETVKSIEAKRGAASGEATPHLERVDPAILKDAFLSEVRKAKKFFFNTVVAQAQRIEFTADRVVFTFTPQHRALRAQLEQIRPWLETAASQLAGRKIAVATADGGVAADGPPADAAFGGTAAAPPAMDAAAGGDADRAKTLKDRALSDPGVQTMLDVFAAEIKDVEER
jgi:DNA polymerase III gamma/tau subunit